jgi:hypothetical protein
VMDTQRFWIKYLKFHFCSFELRKIFILLGLAGQLGRLFDRTQLRRLIDIVWSRKLNVKNDMCKRYTYSYVRTS